MLLFCLMLGSGRLFAQENLVSDAEKDAIRLACSCSELEKIVKPANGFMSEAAVEKEVDKVKKMIFRDSHLITVKSMESFCTSIAKALGPCSGSLYYILYNPGFFDQFTRNSKAGEQFNPKEVFVFSHELAHIALGHTSKHYVHDDQKRNELNVSGKSSRKKDMAIEHKRGMENDPEVYPFAASAEHRIELAADVLAIHVFRSMNKKKEEINDLFYKMYYVLDLLTKSKSNETLPDLNDSHPSPRHRDYFFNRVWRELEKKDYTMEEMIRSKAKDFADDIYGSILLNNSNKIMRNIEMSAFMGTGLVNFKDNAAFTMPLAYGAGLKYVYLDWINPHGYEAEVSFNHLQFSSLTKVGGEDKKLEDLGFNYLSFKPKYVYHSIGQQGKKVNDMYLRRRGFYTGLGVSLNVPLSSSYFNYGINRSETKAVKYSISPVIELGFEKLTREDRRLNTRLGVSYQPMTLSFKNENVRGNLNVFNINYAIHIR